MADDDGMDTSAYSMDDLREGLKYLEEIPQALIITNLSESVFLKPDHPDSRQVEFEERIHQFDTSAKIAYLKNFRRARIEFVSGPVAALVKFNLHKTQVCGSEVKAFFVQVPALYDSPDKSSLKLPTLEKQFLISPPASPPVGWEPITEHEPVLNYDIIHAMLSLSPEGGQHELHAGSDQHNIPKIVVHLTSDDDPATPTGGYLNKGTIVQTRRPPIETSMDTNDSDPAEMDE